MNLFYEIHLERATDAAVLQSHEAFVFLSHNAALLDEVRVDVDFADIIHDDGKFNAALVGENTIE